MTNKSVFTEAGSALRFMLGGNSTMTVVSQKTGVRYTYKVQKADRGALYFVSVLTGSDNASSYTYIGVIRITEFALTAKSKMTADALPVRGFKYVLGALLTGSVPGNVELWHEGQCGRCGRKLTVPESIASGIGPECKLKLAA